MWGCAVLLRLLAKEGAAAEDDFFSAELFLLRLKIIVVIDIGIG